MRRRVLLLIGGDGAFALALFLHLEADDLHPLDVLDSLPQTLAEAGAEELVAALYEDELLDRPPTGGDDLDALPTHRRQVLQLLARQVAQAPTYARNQPAREGHVCVAEAGAEERDERRAERRQPVGDVEEPRLLTVHLLVAVEEGRHRRQRQRRERRRAFLVVVRRRLGGRGYLLRFPVQRGLRGVALDARALAVRDRLGLRLLPARVRLVVVRAVGPLDLRLDGGERDGDLLLTLVRDRELDDVEVVCDALAEERRRGAVVEHRVPVFEVLVLLRPDLLRGDVGLHLSGRGERRGLRLFRPVRPDAGRGVHQDRVSGPARARTVRRRQRLRARLRVRLRRRALALSDRDGRAGEAQRLAVAVVAIELEVHVNEFVVHVENFRLLDAQVCVARHERDLDAALDIRAPLLPIGQLVRVLQVRAAAVLHLLLRLRPERVIRRGFRAVAQRLDDRLARQLLVAEQVVFGGYGRGGLVAEVLALDLQTTDAVGTLEEDDDRRVYLRLDGVLLLLRRELSGRRRHPAGVAACVFLCLYVRGGDDESRVVAVVGVDAHVHVLDLELGGCPEVGLDARGRDAADGDVRRASRGETQ